jgi:hypothetical protein
MAYLEYTLKQGGESTAGKINAKLLTAIIRARHGQGGATWQGLFADRKAKDLAT